jgi:hypothetical protein
MFEPVSSAECLCDSPKIGCQQLLDFRLNFLRDASVKSLSYTAGAASKRMSSICRTTPRSSSLWSGHSRRETETIACGFSF